LIHFYKREIEIRMSGEIYNVEKILGKKRGEEGQWLYRVKWEGYGVEENTWEPADHFHSPQLVENFEQQWREEKDNDWKRKERKRKAEVYGEKKERKVEVYGEKKERNVEVYGEKRERNVEVYGEKKERKEKKKKKEETAVSSSLDQEEGDQKNKNVKDQERKKQAESDGYKKEKKEKTAGSSGLGQGKGGGIWKKNKNITDQEMKRQSRVDGEKREKKEKAAGSSSLGTELGGEERRKKKDQDGGGKSYQGLRVTKILGAQQVSGEVYFYLQWENQKKGFVKAKEAHRKIPKMCCKYYSDKIVWNKNNNS